ncbi:MAG: ABC transporter permease [Clostridium sp.]|nr:ABC transporter permease [Clostridium sp.]
MNKNLYLIIRREYLERVRRKSFIITTILMPIFMVGVMVAPALAMILAGTESKDIAVVDFTEQISPMLQNTDELTFRPVGQDIPIDSLKKAENYDGVIVIGADAVDNPGNIQMYTHNAPSMMTESYISDQMKGAIREIRIKRYDIENLDRILKEIEPKVSITTYRLDTEEEEETSSTVAYLLGIAMMMTLYMFILIYGQMVMTSIIEEKNNRVLEVVVSSVKPGTLMLGKILGIGLVAVTQIVIWGVLIAAVSFWGMPILSATAAAEGDADLMAMMAQFGDTGRILMYFAYILLFMIGGYMLYSSVYAAIGSAVDNIQDASQLSSIPTIPIILGIVFSMVVVQDPTSSLAFWLGIIPLTSPMVMMARLPFGVPGWEIWLSLALLFAGFVFMVWLSAKIYRVGIFMYGKKPSVKDLIRWARYK